MSVIKDLRFALCWKVLIIVVGTEQSAPYSKFLCIPIKSKDYYVSIILNL